jgi:hypothetical protein
MGNFKVSEMIQSRYLRQTDLEDGDAVVVTMKGVEKEKMPGDEDEIRYVLYFRELTKGLVLNATSIRVLEKYFGSTSAEWVGGKVEIFIDPTVQFRGKITGGLRLRPVKPAKATAAPAAAAPPDPIDDSEEQIRF